MYAMMDKFERTKKASNRKERGCDLQESPKPEETNNTRCPKTVEAKNDTGCFCQRPLRSLQPQDIHLFLPQCLPCTCDSHAGVKTDNRDTIALDRILRPWQVRFLKHEYMIRTTTELVSSYNRIGPVMAKGMKEWWLKSFPFESEKDTQSCELALLIWTRACQLIMDANSANGVFLYEIQLRQSCVMQRAEASVPMIVRVPPVEKDDEISECSSQGATTVLEGFLDQIFSSSYFEEDEAIKLENMSFHSGSVETEPPKDWDSDTLATAVEPTVEISNMDDVVLSLEFYRSIDTKTMSRRDQDAHAAKMSSVLNKMDVHLITKESPGDEIKRSMSLVGSKSALIHSSADTVTEATRSTTKSANFIPEEKTTKKSEMKRTSKHNKFPRKKHWHASLNYLATFND